MTLGKLQVHNIEQSVVDTTNRAIDRAWRFWQTAFPKNQYDELLSQGKIPSNTAALGHKPQGRFRPASSPAPGYAWRGRHWADLEGHLQRGGAGYDPARAYHEARERGEEFLGRAEWKGRRGLERAGREGEALVDSARDKGREALQRSKEEGGEFVESVKARGRRGWEQTKEEWEHLKDTVLHKDGTRYYTCPVFHATA